MCRVGSNVNVLHTMRMAVVKRKKIEKRVGEDGTPCSASGHVNKAAGVENSWQLQNH